MSNEESGALKRWSRRKAAARRQDQVTDHDRKLSAAEATEAAELGGDEAADPRALGLTPIEELDENSDYAAFLREGVPEALARAALRKLWSSDPVLANLDGLNDYDEDFNLVDKLLAVVEDNVRPGEGGRDEAAPDSPHRVAPEDRKATDLAAEGVEAAVEPPASGADEIAEAAAEAEDEPASRTDPA